MRILVTDAHELAGLGAVRSLGRAGHEVTAAYPAGPRLAATWSRSRLRYCSYPDPWEVVAPSMEFLSYTLSKRRCTQKALALG
jgi:hypothetical protein